MFAPFAKKPAAARRLTYKLGSGLLGSKLVLLGLPDVLS
jgi:hypothetical protein